LILPSVSRVMLAKAKGARVLLYLYDQIGCLDANVTTDPMIHRGPFTAALLLILDNLGNDLQIFFR